MARGDEGLGMSDERDTAGRSRQTPEVRLSFNGAAGTVTGSRYLVETGDRRVLVDCGLFQGWKQLRLRNWASLPFSPRSIDAVVLTHAHIDHSGYLPRLVRDGFRGPIYCTAATRDLCTILLPDSGHLQEADAEFARRHGFSKHDPPLPLYTEVDARACLHRFRTVDPGAALELGPRMHARFHPVGHILGACSIAIDVGDHRIVFSGDVGRPNDPLMLPPSKRTAGDWLVIESTYGDRLHDPVDPGTVLADAVRRTVERGGIVVVPAFAVGRTQLLLLLLARLLDAKAIPEVPIIVDSPMATSVTDLYASHRSWHRLDLAACRHAFDRVRYTQTADDSKALDERTRPMVLVSASGMATGGRVVHHLKRFAPDEKNLILFAGYQAGGTRGAAMLAGAEAIKIHGDYVPVRAEVRCLDMMSAHADADELLAWLRTESDAPRETFVTHGEPTPSDTLRRRIQDELGWSVRVPEHGDTVEL